MENQIQNNFASSDRDTRKRMNIGFPSDLFGKRGDMMGFFLNSKMPMHDEIPQLPNIDLRSQQ